MLEIREARDVDEAFLFNLYAETRANEMSAWGWGAAEAEPFLRMQFTVQQQSYRLQYPGAEHRLLLLQGNPAGQYRVFNGKDVIVLVDIALMPEYRNRGIGTELLRGLQERARKERKTVRLSVEQSNPASKLYQRLGFMTREHRDPYSIMVWHDDQDQPG
ncbi:GNAT family N-acetyltransferase [Paenibacillus sp. MBLB4367]|uniref:GNAT family N-acetyltransferase n=1 Tax=Paenibacillus sp. MBLB4367 TaxID=3384767 RepID=UPI0039082F34